MGTRYPNTGSLNCHASSGRCRGESLKNRGNSVRGPPRRSFSETTLLCRRRRSRKAEMHPVSPRRAQKRTHSFMNLDLEILAGGIFTVDRENASIPGLDTVRVDFEEVLLLRVHGKEGGRGIEEGIRARSTREIPPLTVSDQY